MSVFVRLCNRCAQQNILRDFTCLSRTVLYKCRKISFKQFSRLAVQVQQDDEEPSELERAELVLLKNILSLELPSNHTKEDITYVSSKYSAENVQKTQETCEDVNSHNKEPASEHVLLWEHIFSNEQNNIMTKLPDVWYADKIMGDSNTNNHHLCYKAEVVDKDHNERVIETSSGPTPDQLSIILLRLREELPYFFQGSHQYSIYSENILFVNRLTRTTTRSLKAYKFLMQSMQYAGKLFWNQVSFDVVRITKHPEDNTIKVRWTVKGIPWHLLPFYFLIGKPQPSLFYRYIDGFSIFEVGRDGLVHCHRLDKVIPTSTAERRRWSLRLQILTLLGLEDINRGACEAIQMKDQEIVKKPT